MQTFLPYDSFKKSAQCLDNKRLRSQTWEALQVYKAITGQQKAWGNHCISRLWKGYSSALREFGIICVEQANGRGLNGLPDIELYECESEEEVVYPYWFGWDVVHSLYRSHLLSKDIGHYGRFGWKDDIRSGYLAVDKFGGLKLFSVE